MHGQVVAMGELLIDFVALERDTSVGEADEFAKAAGGAPANVAVGLAKLAIPSAFITQLGHDPFGHFLKATLVENGVDVGMVKMTDKANTMLAFVAVEGNGERSFAFYRNPSADMLMQAEDLDIMRIAQSAIFHYGSITLIDEPAKSATEAAIRAASKGGAMISYDPNLREVLWPSTAAARQGLLNGLQYANVVKMNLDEIEFLTEQGPFTSMNDLLSAARSLWHSTLHLMVITRGGEGCIALTEDQHWIVPGFEVRVEDTIGAGDGFMAGLLAGIYALESSSLLTDDEHLQQILRQANAVGAMTAARRGAIPALPTHVELQEFLANQT